MTTSFCLGGAAGVTLPPSGVYAAVRILYSIRRSSKDPESPTSTALAREEHALKVCSANRFAACRSADAGSPTPDLTLTPVQAYLKIETSRIHQRTPNPKHPKAKTLNSKPNGVPVRTFGTSLLMACSAPPSSSHVSCYGLAAFASV